MPVAHQGEVKYWLQDHDTDYLNQVPPVQNTWYEVFHAYDVRLIWCVISQWNDEEGGKDIQVRWTIDGNVYVTTVTCSAGVQYYIYRLIGPDSSGTDELNNDTSRVNAAYYVDKRGLDFKVEVRMTSAVGTNQTLQCWCVRETLEQT